MRLIASLLEQSASAVIQDSSPVFLALPQIGSEPHVAPLEQQDTLDASDCTNTGAHPVVEWGNWGSHDGSCLHWRTAHPIHHYHQCPLKIFLKGGAIVWGEMDSIAGEGLVVANCSVLGQTEGSHKLGKLEAVPLLAGAGWAWELPSVCVSLLLHLTDGSVQTTCKDK